MKRVGWCLILMLFLCGCSQENAELKQGMDFRSRLLAANGCQFTANVTADYGDSIHSFSMNCQADQTGAVTFCLTEPETLSGISGKLSDTGGTLTFDEAVLCFPLLTDDQLNPSSAPWIFLKTLRSGYLRYTCREEGKLRLTMDDTYEKDALQLDIWLDDESLPVRADILYDGKRILSVDVTDFMLL